MSGRLILRLPKPTSMRVFDASKLAAHSGCKHPHSTVLCMQYQVEEPHDVIQRLLQNQTFKHLRKTRHSHHPVDDAEALPATKSDMGLKTRL